MYKNEEYNKFYSQILSLVKTKNVQNEIFLCMWLKTRLKPTTDKNDTKNNRNDIKNNQRIHINAFETISNCDPCWQ